MANAGNLVPVFTARRNARIASAVLAPAIPSVCLSVRPSHAGIVSKRRHVARCSLHCRIAIFVSSFVETKNISQGRPLPSENDLRPPEGSEFCLVAPQPQETEKEVQLHLTRTRHGLSSSHQPRLYAAPNFYKMWIKYINLSSFGQF